MKLTIDIKPDLRDRLRQFWSSLGGGDDLRVALVVAARVGLDTLEQRIRGGHARAQRLTPEARSASARKAAQARWRKR